MNLPSGLRLVLVAIGSRGDVQPMLALGQTLRQRGHTVVIAAPPNFSAWVQESGFGFAPIGVDMQQFLADNPAVLTGKIRQAAPIQKQYFSTELPRQMQELHAACTDADLLVWAGLAFCAPSVAERLGIPALGVLYTTCVIPSAAHPPPIVSRQGLPRWVNRLLWHINDWAVKRAVGKPLNLARATLGLAAVNLRNHLLEQCPYMVAVDAQIFPGDPAWPPGLQRSNFLYFNDLSPLDPDLEAWLQSGPPPVYVGFGSMAGFGTQRMDALLQEALLPGGMRVLIGAGWGGLGGQPLPAHWRAVRTAPHDKLFPRMAVVVHHGGSGTTANALRAGVPQVVLPLILDQYHHAYRLYRAGLAPPPIAMEHISARQLAQAIEAARSLPAAPRMAAARRLQQSDAALHIVLRIEALKTAPSPADG